MEKVKTAVMDKLTNADHTHSYTLQRIQIKLASFFLNLHTHKYIQINIERIKYHSQVL